jgi:hypothetical protein
MSSIEKIQNVKYRKRQMSSIEKSETSSIEKSNVKYRKRQMSSIEKDKCQV